MTRKTPDHLGAERILALPTFESGESVPMAATNWVGENQSVEWKPICNDPNNRGNVEIVETDVQGLVELLTNSSDAYLIEHSDDVDSREELLDVLDEDDEVLMEFTGDYSGKSGEYSVIVADEGCGVARNEFEDAFLKDPSTGGVDKRKYEYLYGEFGQGSLASIGVSKTGCKFVASASKEDKQNWSWSVTRYNEDRMRYEYLTVDGEVPTFEGKLRVGDFGKMSFGTITKVFNVDSTQTPRDVTTNPFIRRLGHAFPETAVPLNIVDNRKEQGDRRIWSGMKEELISDPNVDQLTTQETVNGFGTVQFDAFVVDEDRSFDNEFVNSQIRDRIFYTVYGMTHHTESYSALNSKCNLDGIDKSTILFVDCSKLNTPINDIFLPSRTGMKQGSESGYFLDSIHNAVSNWSDIQEIDKNRATVSDIVNTDGSSPIQGLEFADKNRPVPRFNVDDGEFSTEVRVETSVEDYCAWDVVDFDIVGLSGSWDMDVSGDTVRLSVNVDSDETGTICVYDTEFDETLTKTFDIVTEFDDDEVVETQTVVEAQSERATRGNGFESDVVENLSDKTDYTVTIESETPDCVMEKLQFSISGVDIQPDTDVVIHDGKKPKGIVSCKRSLRERVGQTAFWKLFMNDKEMDIPIHLATLDPDNELKEGRKWRAIAEDVLDGVLVFGDDKDHFNDIVKSVNTVGEVQTA